MSGQIRFEDSFKSCNIIKIFQGSPGRGQLGIEGVVYIGDKSKKKKWYLVKTGKILTTLF